MSFAGGGVAADDDRAVILLGNNFQQATATFIITVTLANPTFIAQYRRFPVGSCTFSNRSMFAIPLP